MILTKIELARLQIEKAISLFIDEKDYVCSLTLAGAAEEMLGNMLRTQGKDNVLADLHPWFKDKYKSEISFSDLAKGANVIRDELKHGHENPDPAHGVEISKPIAAQMLMRALVNYTRVAGSPTESMIHAKQWLDSHYKEIFGEWTET